MKRIELDAEGLREEAERAVDRSPYTQSDIADKLDVSRASVNRALNTSGPKFEKLRCRIIELLEPCRVERKRTFVLHPNDE
jgi:predicted DNA-binding protein (UPF0251 family)